MIEVRNLTKRYGAFTAVEDLTFAVPRGEVCGFLGPNGAGKSTTIRVLTGFHPPSAGTALVDGLDVASDGDAVRRRIGYLPETNPLYPEMRVEEYLHFSGSLYGMPRKERARRILEVIPRCGLEKVHRRVVGTLSKGNRQRVGLAAAILHRPPVLILDEPQSGLDPAQMLAFRDLIFELRGRHTILLSSHYIPQVEQAAGFVVILANGRLAAAGTPQELRERAAKGAPVRVEAQCAPERLRALLQALPGAAAVEVEPAGAGARALLTPQPGADVRAAVATALAGAEVPLVELRREAATLEDFFVGSVGAARTLAGA